MVDVIDMHAHDYPDSYLAACRREDSGLDYYVRNDGRQVVLQDGAVALAAPQPMPTVEQRLAAMDQARVAIQVLSVSAPNVYRFPASWRIPLTRDINDELLAAFPASGGRLRTLISLPLPDVDASVAELDRLDGVPGNAGVMITTTVNRQTLDNAAFAPLFEELSHRGSLVLVHPNTGCSTDGVREYALALGIDFIAETTNSIARLVYSGTLDRYPGISWIFCHLGGATPYIIHRFDNFYSQFPECSEYISRPPSEILRDVYFDTVTTHVPALHCAFETFDRGQFVFGSDYPHVPGGLRRFVQTLEAAGLQAEDFAQVARGTAARLLGLD